jgi:integrase
MYRGTADAIIIRRVDILRVHDYARQNCSLRDYMFIRLPLKVGLRTGEVCTLRIENIDFGSRSFQVLDSKRRKLYPLPLDQVSLQLMQDLVGKRVEGYVFTQKCSWMHKRAGVPLTVSTVWICVRKVAEAAGVRGFNPRVLRQFFAADWALSGRNMEVLRRLLRHKSLAYTQIYLSRLVFWEDMQQEYERIQDAPYVGRAALAPPQLAATASLLSPFFQEWCVSCSHVRLCKLIDQTPAWASGCRFYIKNLMEECRNDGKGREAG